MLTSFLEYVSMRVDPVMSLCVIFKTWIETFAYSDVAENSYKNPDEPRHYCQSVRQALLKDSLPSPELFLEVVIVSCVYTYRNHSYDIDSIIGVAFKHFFTQNPDSQPHDANITHTNKFEFLS